MAELAWKMIKTCQLHNPRATPGPGMQNFSRAPTRYGQHKRSLDTTGSRVSWLPTIVQAEFLRHRVNFYFCFYLFFSCSSQAHTAELASLIPLHHSLFKQTFDAIFGLSCPNLCFRQEGHGMVLTGGPFLKELLTG